eukprot:gene8222-5745_t
MPTWLNVAEKPSVAKQISAVLANGRAETTRSHSKYNPVFQFQYRGTNMLVTSVVGHLMEEDFTGAAKSWAGFPIRDLFNAPVSKSVKSSLADLKTNLESLMRRADTLVLWLDCDREGENIGFEVLQIAQAVKQRFTTKRAHFSALTARDIQFAMEHLREPDRRLSEAVDARQEMDLRIGAAFTRFQTLRLRDSIPGVSGVISFGPCQFPTLGFVVRREWARQGFTPEDVFTFRLYHENTTFYATRGEMYDQMAATLLYEDILQRATELPEEAPGSAVVTEVRRRDNHRRPPFPLATVPMQKLAATHLHISSEQCMKLAEALYQEGYVSYPRTETDHFSFTDAELLDFVRVQQENGEGVGEFAQKMLQSPETRFRRPLSGGHDDKAHPPIHPTKLYAGNGDDKHRLYMMIARHFLACLSPDAVDAKTSVTAVYGGQAFTTSGSTIVEQGWTEVFAYAQHRSSVIPNYALHQVFIPTAVKMEKSVTAPPPRLTETALISVMDENGIGTDATIAQHIKTLIDRQYVQRVGQSMVPLPLGMALAAAYEVLGLASLLQPQLRAQMEAAMGDITVGKASKGDVVQAAVGFYREVFDRLSSRGDEFLRLVRLFFHGGSPGATGLPGAAPPEAGDGDAPPPPPGAGTVFLIDAEVRVVSQAFSPCGRCGRSLRLVDVPDDPSGRRFLQCVACRLQLRVPGSRYVDIAPTAPPVVCPICHFTALQAENRERGAGRTNKGYTLCPYCFNQRPGAEFCADIESVGDFRCFQCLHPSCALAKGKELVGITKCISCGINDLRLRKGQSGGHYLACSGYPTCMLKIGLPTATRIDPQPQRRCPNCHAVTLLFDFRGVQPVPGLEEVESICVYCDIRVKDYLKLIHSGQGITAPSGSGSVAAASVPGSAYTLPSIRSIAAGKTSNDSGAAGSVLCGCNQPAKQLVSRKQTSYGRAFWTCARAAPKIKWPMHSHRSLVLNHNVFEMNVADKTVSRSDRPSLLVKSINKFQLSLAFRPSNNNNNNNKKRRTDIYPCFLPLTEDTPVDPALGPADISTAPVRSSSTSRTKFSKPSRNGANTTAIRCNNCFGVGHMKRNCPQIRCNQCGTPGHFKQDCPTTKRSRGEGEDQQGEAGPLNLNIPPHTGDVCHRCGSSRHMQASCPVPLMVECHTCHREGHVMTICPQTRCFNCGSMGHSAQICQSKTHCFHCSVQGHRSSECPMKEKGRVCYQCKEPGHDAAQCPQGIVCRMCRQQGHVVAHCPSVTCNACHQKGHIASDCAIPGSKPAEASIPPKQTAAAGGTHEEEDEAAVVTTPNQSAPSVPQPSYEVAEYQPISTTREGRVVVVIDGPYFERCVRGHQLKSAAQYQKTTAALQQTLAYLGDIFEMEPIAYWFDTSNEAFTAFLETGMPLHCREAAFRDTALRREFLTDEMNSTTGKLRNVVARLEGSMKQQRGYTPDGPGHVWVQSGVDVAIATCLMQHFQDHRLASQVVLLSGDSDIYPAVHYCNAHRRAGLGGSPVGTRPAPPIRVCGTGRTISKPYGLHQDLFDFLPRILLNEEHHTEKGREFYFAPFTAFEDYEVPRLLDVSMSTGRASDMRDTRLELFVVTHMHCFMRLCDSSFLCSGIGGALGLLYCSAFFLCLVTAVTSYEQAERRMMPHYGNLSGRERFLRGEFIGGVQSLSGLWMNPTYYCFCSSLASFFFLFARVAVFLCVNADLSLSLYIYIYCAKTEALAHSWLARQLVRFLLLIIIIARCRQGSGSCWTDTLYPCHRYRATSEDLVPPHGQREQPSRKQIANCLRIEYRFCFFNSRICLVPEAAEGVPLGCSPRLKDYYRYNKRIEDSLRLLMKKTEAESVEGQARKQALQLKMHRLMKANKDIPIARLSAELELATNFSATSDLDNSLTSTVASRTDDAQTHTHTVPTGAGADTTRTFLDEDEEEESEDTSSDDDLETPLLCSMSTAVPDAGTPGMDGLSPEEREQAIALKLQFKQSKRKKKSHNSRSRLSSREASTDASLRTRVEGVNLEKAYRYLLRRVNRRILHDKGIPFFLDTRSDPSASLDASRQGSQAPLSPSREDSRSRSRTVSTDTVRAGSPSEYPSPLARSDGYMQKWSLLHIELAVDASSPTYRTVPYVGTFTYWSY